VEESRWKRAGTWAGYEREMMGIGGRRSQSGAIRPPFTGKFSALSGELAVKKGPVFGSFHGA
jgi:hypothetical protein